MARYDRIARLPPPDRRDTFGCWMTLRDLEGREREPQLGRRARLRFLALRPLRRLLERGLDGLDARSLELQIEGVREELGSLPASDPERLRLGDYLREIGGRSPAGLIRATLDVGAAAEAAGHGWAAEEYYRTGLELAESHQLVGDQVRALRRLGRVAGARGERDAALEHYGTAAELADTAGDRIQWARAVDGAAIIRQREGDIAGALALLDRIERRGVRERNSHLRAIAAAGRCAIHSASDEIESALESGWDAVQLFPPDEEARYPVLLNLAAAFRRMWLREAAESAYQITATRAAWPEHRIEASVEHAATAAEFADAAAFRARRERLLATVRPDDPQMAALLHLGLGRGCMLAGEVDDAREHLRTAIATARDSALDAVLSSAEDLLESLERSAASAEVRAAAPTIPASSDIRRIADGVASLERQLVTSG